MNFVKIIPLFKFFIDLKFAIFLLALIALTSSFGSILEQDESLFFYQQNYSSDKPIYGFIDWKLIFFFGLDHIYTTWWFFALLFLLGTCLISCTLTRQFPLYLNSKEFFFKKQRNSFLALPFFIKIQNPSYFKELILLKIQTMNFYIYQKDNLIYGYKGLIGRISPILVHFSLILILGGSFLGAFENYKVQEVLPKGELFHIQNPIRIGSLTSLSAVNVRINDFWVEYEKNRIHQFYSNISILNNLGEEIKEQTISVNNPLRYNQVDFYQSDWNLLGIRVENILQKKIYEFPLFSLPQNSKIWITWITNSNNNFTLIFDQLQYVFFLYDQSGIFLNFKNVGDFILPNLRIIDILPSTGLLIKYDPSILVIYFGFGLLMITTCLSYLPYTQIWIFSSLNNALSFSWIGSSTNRGKIQLEIEFENFIRFLENNLIKQKKKYKF